MPCFFIVDFVVNSHTERLVFVFFLIKIAMNTKNHIAQTAFQLFTHNGYKATSIAQLVSNSGLSKGAFYHHFKSKQAIYEYVIDSYFLSYYRSVDWSSFEKMSLEELLDLITQMYLDFIAQIRILTEGNISKYFILFFDAYNNIKVFKTEIQVFYKRFQAILSKKYIIEKKFSKEYAEKKSMQLISKFEGLFFWSAVFPEEDIKQYLVSK